MWDVMGAGAAAAGKLFPSISPAWSALGPIHPCVGFHLPLGNTDAQPHPTSGMLGRAWGVGFGMEPYFWWWPLIPKQDMGIGLGSCHLPTEHV